MASLYLYPRGSLQRRFSGQTLCRADVEQDREDIDERSRALPTRSPQRGPIPPVLVRSPGCSRTPPRPHGSVNANEWEGKE